MITPKISQPSAAVALHYNELDPFYREIWGHHVHHGYWRTGKETSTEAAEALSELVAERLDLKPGLSVCDIGCGYGETARLFSSRYGVALEGVTISESQFRVAADRRAPGVSISLCDWLQNGFPDCRFDRAYAIESSEHIGDKHRFFSEAFRVLRPGGRLVVCAWLAKAGASGLEQRLLLEPICRHGRLPGMGTEEDYRALASSAGFRCARRRRHQPECSAHLGHMHQKVGLQAIQRPALQAVSVCARRAEQGFRTHAVLDPGSIRHRRDALLRFHVAEASFVVQLHREWSLSPPSRLHLRKRAEGMHPVGETE